jgi:hypothetical protein
MGRYILQCIVKPSLKDLLRHKWSYLRLFKYAFTGLEIVYGAKPHFIPKYKRVVCMGNCIKKLARENGYAHIPGCPPTKEDMLRYL